ncbi:MAG: AsmA family protein [Hyphomicrobiaceae bacterium]
MRPLARLLGYAALGLACLVLAAASFVYMAIPTDFVREQLVRQVREATGRDLVVAGGASLTFYPRLGIALKDVTLSPPKGMRSDAFIEMGSLDVNVPLLPLLRREISVDRFVLVKPVFRLAVDKKGRRTWDFAMPADAGGEAEAVATEPTPELRTSVGSGGGTGEGAKDEVAADADRPVDLSALAGLRLGDIAIVDGRLVYEDERNGAREEISGIEMRLSLPSLDEALTAKGLVEWRGESLPFEINIEAPRELAEGGRSKVDFRLDGEPLQSRFSGEVTVTPEPAVAGMLELDTPSVRRLARLGGAALPKAEGFGALSLRSALSFVKDTIAVKKARITLDGATMTGEVAVGLGGKAPRITADLALDVLDANKYLGGGGGSAAGDDAPAELMEAAEVSGGTPTADDADAGDTARKSKKRRRAKAGRAADGWSTDPIDLTGLGLVDAEASLTVGRLLYQELVLDRSVLKVSLKGGMLKARFPEIALYGGKGVGTVIVDSRRPTLRLDSNFTVAGVKALPLLSDAADFERIDGRADLSFGFTGQGRNQRDIVRTLTGQGRFAFNDGAVVGINVAKIVRGIGRGQLSGWQSGADERTDFSELSGTFTITAGTVTNTDLKLVSPLLRVAGSGTADMPARTLDYTIEPKLVASLEGQGTTGGEKGIVIPVRITGSWDEPRFAPDLAGVIKDPKAALGVLQEIGKGASKKKGAVAEALGALTGKDPAKKKAVGDMLQQMLGGSGN